MLAYILALAVALGSLGIYLAAFFFPEIHRKYDFIWSGVGLFYALVLWVCAGRITGGLLLGQVAGVALLGWSVTQTLQLRRQLTPSTGQTELPSASQVKSTVGEQISKLSLPQRLSGLGKRFGGSATAAKDRLEQVTDGSKRQRTTEASNASASEALVNEAPASPVTEVAPNVQVIDSRTPIPQPTADTATTVEPQPVDTVTTVELQPVDTATTVEPQTPEGGAEVVLETEAENEPILPESEAIALAVEATLAEDTPTETPELVRPHPPDPELVEAAIEDAEEKHQEAHPPEADHNSEQTDR
jgi:hypothetical protein